MCFPVQIGNHPQCTSSNALMLPKPGWYLFWSTTSLTCLPPHSAGGLTTTDRLASQTTPYYTTKCTTFDQTPMGPGQMQCTIQGIGCRMGRWHRLVRIKLLHTARCFNLSYKVMMELYFFYISKFGISNSYSSDLLFGLSGFFPSTIK